MATNVIKSVISGNAAKSAAENQANAARDAANASLSQYQQTREDMMPWLNQGTAAVNKLGSLLGTSGTTTDAGYGSLLKTFGMSDFQADPGYEFRQSEAQKALERSAAAKGNLLSGAAAKAIQQRGQDIASDEYQNAYNRFNTNQTNVYNRLAGVGNTGQVTANTLGTQGANATNQANSYNTDAAAALASGIVGRANAWTTGLQGIEDKAQNASGMLLRGGF